MDERGNLKIKGYGDPLLISEVWQEIAHALAERVPRFNDLIVDDSYFSPGIVIPGRGRSTNPYDAPVGALCANFNTIFFHRDPKGRLVSSEPQTPMVPFARDKIRSLGLTRGRYTFSHDPHDGSRYAGELLRHFLAKRGIRGNQEIRSGRVVPEDRLIYTYRSRFSLATAVNKMLTFSNNFMANQLLIALGARIHGPPGTLAKGTRVAASFAEQVLGMKGFEIAEGSGISRRNRLSALHMLAVLDRFRPHRHLLKGNRDLRFKTGSLRGVRTRAGYVEGPPQGPFSFVIFMNRTHGRIDALMHCLSKALSVASGMSR
jgi:D-alanyl-D-alanine carboxypeptidase/D-alanyl-D-alanine-endopeptidase (penicillin-binding protein 4)